jgi:8-oxo-dGTP pyrophosphatase MutT (NUDIX family)
VTLDQIRIRMAEAAARPHVALTGDRDQELDPGGWTDVNVGPLTPAAVLVPVITHQRVPSVLFTKRNAGLRKHAGQISFPGGRMDDSDPSLEFTALREAHEEVGLDPAHVDVIGRLGNYETGTGFRVTPVVGFVPPGLSLTLAADEVDEVFEAPLAFLLDPANHERHVKEWRGRDRHYFAIPYGDHYIWGATAGMLVNFSRLLRGA